MGHGESILYRILLSKGPLVSVFLNILNVDLSKNPLFWINRLALVLKLQYKVSDNYFSPCTKCIITLCDVLGLEL